MRELPAGLSHKQEHRLLRQSYCSECKGDVHIYADVGSKVRKIGCRHHPDATVVKDYTPRDPKLQMLGVYDAGDRKKVEDTIGQEKSTALMAKGIPLNGVITKSQLMEVFQTVWPGADELAIFKGVAICQAFGLHPLMKHLYLIPFKNRQSGETKYEPVLGIAATRLIAGKHGDWSFDDMTPRFMTEEEQMKVWGEVFPDHVCAITILLNKWGGKTYGYGKWKKTTSDGKPNNPQGVDKGNTMLNMAMIRSERNGLGKLAPEPDVLNGVRSMDEKFTSISDVGDDDEDITDVPYIVEGETVNTKTGAITAADDAAVDTPFPPAAAEEGELFPPVTEAKAPAIDTAVITKADQTSLTKAMGKVKWGMLELGNYCREQEWGIDNMADLQKWQVTALLTHIKTLAK